MYHSEKHAASKIQPFHILVFIFFITTLHLFFNGQKHNKNVMDFEEELKKEAIDPEEIFKSRRKHLVSACRNIKQLNKFFSKHKDWPGLFLNYIDNSLACFIPKAGSTSWKRVFNAIHSNTTIEDEGPVLNGEFNQDFYLKLPRLNSVPKYKNKKIQAIDFSTWENRLIIVRHPFTRLYSAWKDKFFYHPESKIKGYNEILSAKEWQKYLAQIKKFEKNKNNKFIHKPENAKISFDSFLEAIIKDSGFQNMHWASYFSECWPCDVPYNFIIKLENIDEEADFIMEKIKAPERIGNFPKKNHHSTGKNDVEKVAEVFRKYDKSFIEKLYKKYSLDFEIFGYSLDTFVQ